MGDELAFIPIGVDPPARLSDAARERAVSRDDFTLSTIVHRLREWSIDINRLTCPKLIAQLSSAPNRPIDIVLCNALDADGDARLNAIVLRAFVEDVLTGLRVINRAVSAQQTTIVIDSNLPRPTGIYGRRAVDQPTVVSIDAAYPQMHSSLLLQRLFRRRLLPGQLPVERGVLMIDAAAAWMIARLAADETAVAMPVLVLDDRAARAIAALVAPELTLGEILAALRIRLDQRTLVLHGARLRKRRALLDVRAAALDPIIHLCSAERPAPAEPCVRCNWCAEVCPTGVLPMLVLEAAQFDGPAVADRAGLRRCVSCGLCDYVCPSRLPLTVAIDQLNARLSPVGLDG